MQRRHVTRAVRKTTAALVAALVCGAVAAPSFAGHDEGRSYTGCLDVGTNKGNLYRVAEGDSPTEPCKDGDPMVHLASGDITSVIAGAGLEGGADSGPATLSLGAAYLLPQLCANGQVPKWAGSQWICANDNDTTYSAGAGLERSGTTFRVRPSYQLPQNCDSGELTAWDGSAWICLAAPTHTGVVARLDAGHVFAIGSNDTDLCDTGQNDGGTAGPFSSTSGNVHLPPGDYMVIHAGLHWQITKLAEAGWDDADIFYGGRVSASVFQTHFDRNVNTRGLIADDDRNFGLFTISNPQGSDVHLEIEAYAWPCSHASISGQVAIVRLGGS